MRSYFTLQWHITAECDQHCRHCYIYNSPEINAEIKNSKKIKYQFLKGIADNFMSSCERLNALPIFSLTGGDPILSPYFWKLVRYLKSKRVEMGIMGNPFHITNDVAERLRRYGVSNYQLSLDGLEQTHDSMRKNGSFKATFKAARALMKYGIKVNIMSTVSKLNSHEIPQLTKLIAKAGIDSASFARYCPTSKEDKALIFKPNEYRTFLLTMFRTYFQELYRVRTKFYLKDHLWALLLHEMGYFFPSSHDGCGMAGMKHMTVLPDGTVYACRRFKSPVGKVPEKRFADIFLGKKMAAYRIPYNYRKCSKCELFTHCRGCSAVSYCATGSWKSPDPQCWKLNERSKKRK